MQGLDERDHLFRLAGQHAPPRCATGDHIGPGLARVLDRLSDTPAEIVTELGDTLRQTPLSVALTGPTAHLTGPERSRGYRWFVDPASRDRHAPEEHAFLSRLYASGLRTIVGLRGPGSRAAGLVDLLLERSGEFRPLWDAHEVGLEPHELKTYQHPTVGRIAVLRSVRATDLLAAMDATIRQCRTSLCPS